MGEGSKEAIQGALWDRSGLTEQFVEQVVSVFRTELASADALRCRREGGVGRPRA
jgi:hypothetical protein